MLVLNMKVGTLSLFMKVKPEDEVRPNKKKCWNVVLGTDTARTRNIGVQAKIYTFKPSRQLPR